MSEFTDQRMSQNPRSKQPNETEVNNVQIERDLSCPTRMMTEIWSTFFDKGFLQGDSFERNQSILHNSDGRFQVFDKSHHGLYFTDLDLTSFLFKQMKR